MGIAHTSRLTPRSGARARSQAGETLIEVLVAIILMGIGFTAVIGGIYTSVRIAEVNKRYTKASVLVQMMAETVMQPAKDPPPGATPGQISASASLYRPCATPDPGGTYALSGIGLPGYVLPTGWTAKITKVEYFTGWDIYLGGVHKAKWDTNTAACTALPSYASPPPGDVARDKGLQRITVEVSNNDPDRPVVDTLVLVKRDRRCPTSFDNADKGPC